MTTERVRKSEKFTKEEYSALVKWVNSQLTKIDAGELLGISRQTLDRVLITKSGSPDTVNKIRGVINQKDGLEQGSEATTK